MKSREMASLAGVALSIAAGLGGCGRGDGAGQQAKGQFESVAGSLTGDQHLRRQGRKDEVVGGVRKSVGDLKAAVHDASK